MKVTVPGIVVFTVLVVAFFAWVGGPPTMPHDHSVTRRAFRFWFYCSLLFVAGAATACFGDKQYGMFPPTSLRWLFIIVGVFIMVVSTAWIYSLVKARTSEDARQAVALLQQFPASVVRARVFPTRILRQAWPLLQPPHSAF